MSDLILIKAALSHELTQEWNFIKVITDGTVQSPREEVDKSFDHIERLASLIRKLKDDYKLVPTEPTKAMLDAGEEVLMNTEESEAKAVMTLVHKAMLDAVED